MKTAPATTAANATRRVTIRAGRDTSHHPASSRRRAHATGPAAMSPELCGPEVSSGPDLAIVRLAWATWEALNDEIVMIWAPIAGTLPTLASILDTVRPDPHTDCYRLRLPQHPSPQNPRCQGL